MEKRTKILHLAARAILENNVSSDKTIFVGAKLHSQVKFDTLSDTPKRVSNGAEKSKSIDYFPSELKLSRDMIHVPHEKRIDERLGR